MCGPYSYSYAADACLCFGIRLADVDPHVAD